MKKLLVGLVVVAVAIAGYWGVTHYQRYSFIEAIRPHVKNTSLRLANASRFETEEYKITFKEIFEKLESDIGEIDKRILEVQTITPPSRKIVTDPVLDYMRGGQELLRALLAKYRAHLSASTAVELAEKAAEDVRTSSSYRLRYELDMWDKALKDQKQAVEKYKNSISDVGPTVKTLKDALTRVAAVLPSDVLVDPALLAAIDKKNERREKGQHAAEVAPPATHKGSEPASPPGLYGLRPPIAQGNEPAPILRAAVPAPTQAAHEVKQTEHEKEARPDNRIERRPKNRPRVQTESPFE